MSSTPFEGPMSPESVGVFRDRLKHGQNVAKILESQVDTAQQNIVLLQGQVRLANETISNLKKYFQETENLLGKLYEPDACTQQQQLVKDVPLKRNGSPPSMTDSGNESNKSYDGKDSNNNKSPYAQQLRQVLDALQDEDSRPQRGGATPASTMNGVVEHNNNNNHCGGKCHPVVSYVPFGYHLVDAATAAVVPLPSDVSSPVQVGIRGVRGGKRMYEEIPSAATSTTTAAHIMKYNTTKVKKVETGGGKLNAQKMLQDFSKRRFFTYNPRFDLDLLIVPPPIPATELMKELRGRVRSEQQLPTSTAGSQASVDSSMNNSTLHNVDDHKEVSLVMDLKKELDVHDNNSSNGFSSPSSDQNGTVNKQIDIDQESIHAVFKSPGGSTKILPTIKEENREGRRRLESHIAMMRSADNNNNGNNNSYRIIMKQEATVSPLKVAGAQCAS